jgi:hypothetical protein
MHAHQGLVTGSFWVSVPLPLPAGLQHPVPRACSCGVQLWWRLRWSCGVVVCTTALLLLHPCPGDDDAGGHSAGLGGPDTIGCSCRAAHVIF